MSKQNTIMDESTALPSSFSVDPDVMAAEKSVAMYASTDEFLKLKAHLQGRKEYYQTFLPNGIPIKDAVPTAEMVNSWIIANTIINEIDVIIQAYEGIAEAYRRNNAERRG